MKYVTSFLTVLAILGLTATVQGDHHLKPVRLGGVWKVEASTDGGERELTWTIKKEGTKHSGVSYDHESDEERDFDRITVKEKKVTMEMDIEQDGMTGIIRIQGEETAVGKLAGKWSIVGDDGTEFMSGKFEAMKDVQFAGEWEAVSMLPNGDELESMVVLTGKNKRLKGHIEGDNGKIELDKIRAKDGTFRIEFDFDMNGNTIDCVIEAKTEGENKLVGKWIVPTPEGGEMTGDWHAARKAKGIAGDWSVVAVVPDSPDYKGTLSLAMENGKLTGKSSGDHGDSSKLKSAKFDGKLLTLSFPFERDGYDLTIEVEAKLQKDGSLDGEWAAIDDSGQQLMQDSWKATRKD